MKQTSIENKKLLTPQEIEENNKLSAIEAREKKNAENRKNLMAMCERDREKVKGIFHFYECEGGTLSFPFKAYKWDQIENYTLVDGQIYTIPLGVAKHLNKNGWYPIHHHMLDKDGVASMRIGSKKRRFGFQGLDFIDPEEIGESRASEIVTVTHV